MGVLAPFKASGSCFGISRLKYDEKCKYFIGFIRVCKNKDAVAAERWSPAPPFSGHSNIIFENPYKTNEILTLLVSQITFSF